MERSARHEAGLVDSDSVDSVIGPAPHDSGPA